MTIYTLAQLDRSGKAIEVVFQSDNTAHVRPGDVALLDGMNPMPDVAWTTNDGGLTFQPPTADSVLANQVALLAKAHLALQANADYLAISGQPSQLQVVNQVNRLTKECTAIIRLLLNELDSQSGT